MSTSALVGQGSLVGGPCEGCEAVFEYGSRELTNTDTLPGFYKHTPKLKITGTIYENDGKTPAEGVILYVYHTNQKGIYPTTGDEEGWARRHGFIRGWVKTGSDGKYAFYTFKPGSYSGNPAHIHPTILEPNGKYYWLGSYLFEGDPNITDRQRNQKKPRGGNNSILKLSKKNGLLVGRRDIVLGKNIQGYNR
ncbi:MAG: intradiol ring-cleavage dioxygenase [Balneolaceae bacterium]|nr:intradiol ring-cleavage dioxygenase [Balneolaceae bacterium]